MEIESRLKTALDESRLLILGAQVLFGFQFEAVFQELFADIPASSRTIHCAGLVMLLISVGLLIAPGIAVYRLVRARAHREQLRQAEFMVTPQCSALWETVSRLEGGD